MPRSTTLFPATTLARIMRSYTNLSVSKQSAKRVSIACENFVQNKAKKSIAHAQHVARSTLLDRDVLL